MQRQVHCYNHPAVAALIYCVHTRTRTHTTVLQPFFRDYPGEPLPEEIFFWTFMVQGEITEADTSTIRLVTTLSALISSSPMSSPHFTPDALPAATLPLYPGLQQAPNMLACTPSGVVYSNSNSKVLILHPIPVDRGRITKQIRISDSNNMFSVFCEISLSTTAVSGLWAACSMHVVRQQRKLCHRFVDVSVV